MDMSVFEDMVYFLFWKSYPFQGENKHSNKQDQKFMIPEVYIYFRGACDVFRLKSIFRKKFARAKMKCNLD